MMDHAELELRQQDAQQVFRGNGGPAGMGIAVVEQLVRSGQNSVDQDLSSAQLVVRADSFVRLN